LAKCLTRIALGFGGRLCHFFTFSPSSTASRASLSALRRLWFAWNSGSAWLSDIVCLDESGWSPSLELVRNLLLGRPLRLDHLLFPFSPSSTRRRMASGRETTSSCFSRQSSIADSSVSCQRMPICVPLPVVGGRPRFFFGVPLIALFINTGYHKSRPRRRSQLPPRP
jgi:hypothetical protein